MTKIRLPSYKRTSRTAKWYNTNEKEKFCKFCNQGQVETEAQFLFHCTKYADARKTRGTRNQGTRKN